MTEPASLPAVGTRVPARLRIVGWLLLTTALGLVALVTATTSTLRADVARAANDDVVQEVAEFRTLARQGTDPETGSRFGSPERLFTVFLRGQRPGTGEYLLGQIADGRVLQSRGAAPDVVGDYDPAADRELLDAVERRDSGVLDTSVGEVRWARSELRDDAGRVTGRFIVATVLEPAQRRVDRIRTLMSWVSLGVLAITSAMAWVVAGRILRPVRDMRRTAALIGDADPGTRLPISGRDDIAALGTEFNALLDRLEGALITEQRFAEGAAAELLAPIRRMRASLEGDRTPPGPRAVLDGELDRMTRTVEDLRILAQAERGDFVRRREVDLDDLREQLDAELRLVRPSGWRLEHADTGVVLVDPERLAQAVAQLAENAIEHGPTEHEVVWSLRVIEGGPPPARALEIGVRDSGPGVAADDAERIFGRFAHAGEHWDDSTEIGLGLAIVRAVAVAHGGSAFVTSGVEGGATFGLTVPLDAMAGDPRG